MSNNNLSDNNYDNLFVLGDNVNKLLPTTTTSGLSNNDIIATKSNDVIGFWDSVTDERVNDYYLLEGGPSIILTIVGIYLYFVLYLGPRLMAKHESFKLNKLLLVYNLSMALTNLWIFKEGLYVSNYGLDTLGCQKFGGDIKRGIYLGYLFFLTKLVELLDTVFFILRKKKEQITFLHVFHHSFVPVFCWAGLKIAPGGPNGFFPLINSCIHVVMYFYYGLSTFGPRIQPFLWWKKYLTTLQMIQFILVMFNCIITSLSRDCKFPVMFLYLQGVVSTTFLILFAMFYRNAYVEKKKNKNKINSKKTTKSDDLLNNPQKSLESNKLELQQKHKGRNNNNNNNLTQDNNDNLSFHSVGKQRRTKPMETSKLL